MNALLIKTQLAKFYAHFNFSSRGRLVVAPFSGT